MSVHVSPLSLEHMRMGSLPPAAQAELELHLEQCPRCQALQQELHGYHADFGAVREPAWVQIQNDLEQARRRRPFRWALWGLGAAVPALAAAMLLLMVQPAPMDDSGVRTKGDPIVEIVIRRGHAVMPAASGSTVKPGDQVGFLTTAAGWEHVMILGRDSTGTITTYLAPEGRSAATSSQARTRLPLAIELDATPGAEELLVLFSRQPLLASDVRARWAAKLPWPEGVHVSHFVLPKETR